MQLIQRVN